MHDQAYRDKFWAFVSVFGTLWGGLELTLGTFLHVLHVPKTGFIMVTLSLILLLAQRRIFPARGSTLCIGVVAACIKSLSPGGIILGPMLWILGEALFVELCLLSGTGAVTSLSAGAVALFWSQVQSLFKLWLYYGKDFLDGVISMVEKFLRIEWTSTLSWGLLGLWGGIIVITGATAGLVGRRIGRRVTAALEEANAGQDVHEPLQIPENPTFYGHSKRSLDAQILKTRFLVLPFALLSLAIQFSGNLLWSSIGLAVWIAVLGVCAHGVIRAIWWPRFWALTVAISVLCGVFIAWGLDGEWQWQLGCEATARMLVRGLYVFSLIQWATRCVRPSEFMSCWHKLGLDPLGLALMRAYVLLPAWNDRMQALLNNRPKGLLNTLRYVRESTFHCLIDAVKQTERL